MKKFNFSIILIFLFLAINNALGLPFEALGFSKITQKDGLSNNIIECIFKDSDGFMWFGTRNGLCRFDGFEIKIYRSDNKPNSLSGDRILSLSEDNKGNLWIGTYSSGLNKFNKKNETFRHFGGQYSFGERINRIKLFRDGSVWICTNWGLAKYLPETDSFKVYKPVSGNSGSINAFSIYDILETRNGDIYVATESDEIQKFDPHTETFKSIAYKRDPSLTNNYKKTLIEDSYGIIWISANVHGLCSYNPSEGKSEIYTMGKNQLTSNVLMGDMALDREGNLWICTDGGGLNILNTKSLDFQSIRKDEEKISSLASDHIYTVYFDDNNILWVGTFGEGVNYYDPSKYKFNSYLTKPGDLSFLHNKSVISLYQDTKQRIWAGTDGQGLYMIDNSGKISEFHYRPDNFNSLSTDVITSLNEDANGNILIGTYSGGFLSYDADRRIFTRFNTDDKSIEHIHSANVWNICRDSKNRIWLGLLASGVDLFNPETRTFINCGPAAQGSLKIDFSNVMAIIEDSDGDIWFGTEGRGIYILDNQTGKIYQIPATSNQNITTQGIIKCLYQDKWGFIWIGTEGRGLFKLDKKNNELINYTIYDGISSNIVQGIQEDNQGNLWISTSNGLTMFNHNTEKFHQFIEEDGLMGNEFNPNALIKLADGRLVLGSTKGIDIFQPQNVTFNQNLPRVIITKLEVLNKEISAGDTLNGRVILKNSINYTNSILLTYKEKVFSVEFAALNYTLPKKCLFSYKLDGFDENWILALSGQRRISYSNLPPGNYTLRIKASNNDGKWGNNERLLMIRVLPPFYRTWWFKTFLILLLLTTSYLIYRYRLNQHKARFRQKQMEQQGRIMELEKEKLESELQKLTFHVINRNRVLIDQKNRLLGLSLKAREVVKIGLVEIISEIDEELNDDKEWKYIEPQLDKAYNNFVTRLKEKNPDLTLSEIKIAAYVRMNLSTKEISEFMHKTARAIENDRYRLRKKIGLDSNDSLQQYLMNL